MERKDLQRKADEDEKQDKTLRMADTVPPPRHYA